MIANPQKLICDDTAEIENLQSIIDLAGRGQHKQAIISIDTKKKELLGGFYRAGHIYTQGEIEAYDHDLASFAHGKVDSTWYLRSNP